MTIHNPLQGEQAGQGDQPEQEHMSQVRRERVTRIMSLIGIDKISQTEVERSVRFIDGFPKAGAENGGYNFEAPRTTDEKAADRRTAAALDRLAIEFKKPHRNKFVASFFDLDLIQKCVSHCNRRAALELPKPKRRDGAVKQRATHEAAHLLLRAGLPLNLTRNGKFCQLAAILDCGDAKQARHYQPACRVVKALRNQG